MKTLKFVSHLVPLVLSGEKTSTWRLFDEKDLQTGDELIFINKSTLEEFAKAKITSVREKKFKDVTAEDYDGHEPFETAEQMYENYRKYYGDKVTPETMVKIVTFELTEKL